MKTDNLLVYKLDWGSAYVDSYNVFTKTGTLVFNFNFTEGLYEEIIAYSVGQIIWTHINLPPSSKIQIIYDVRGLEYNDDLFRKFEDDIQGRIKSYDKNIEVTLVFNK